MSGFLVLLPLLAGAPAPAQVQEVEHVLHVSVDGLSGTLLADMLAGLPTTELTAFRRLVAEGASTFNARNDYGHPKTAPNHTTMLTGRPVLQPALQAADVHHGYTFNAQPLETDTLWSLGNPALSYVASTFDVVHDHGRSTALYASKPKFDIFEFSWDADDGAPDLVAEDDGTDKIDTYLQDAVGNPKKATPMHAAFLADMAAQRYTYAFVHYLDPDAFGHAAGWGTAAYENAIREVDAYLKDLFALIEDDPLLDGRTVIVLTSDHGGVDKAHADPAELAVYTVPFFVWGPGVEAGADLYALNPVTRLDPGSGRPDYDAPVQPVRAGDSGNLALKLLGLPPVPGSTVNANQDLLWRTAPATATLGCGVNPAGSLTVLSGTIALGAQVDLGIHNPLGTQAAGATATYLAISLMPDPAWPCGTSLPGYGMAGGGAAGELLLSLDPGDLAPVLWGPLWPGDAPAQVSFTIPGANAWIGTPLYAQGLLVDPVGVAPVALTEALELVVGP